MVTLAALHEYGEELQKRLRLRTFPLAIKMLEKEEDIPEGAVRPKKDLGYHLLACQGFAMSRREGKMVVMLKDDMWCSESVMGFGLAEAPQYFLDGYSRFPETNKTLEAGSAWAHEFPRFQAGKYTGVVSAPLVTASFEPDVVVAYCDMVQLQCLLMARSWEEGHELKGTIPTKGACIYAVVPTMQTGEYQVTVPCPGDTGWAMAQSDEIIFTVPRKKIEDLVLAMRELEDKYGYNVNRRFTMTPHEPYIKESYHKIGRMTGMEQ